MWMDKNRYLVSYWTKILEIQKILSCEIPIDLRKNFISLIWLFVKAYRPLGSLLPIFYQ